MKLVLLPPRLFDKALHAVEDNIEAMEEMGLHKPGEAANTYTALHDRSILIAEPTTDTDLDLIAIRMSDDECYIVREAIEVSCETDEDLTQEEYQTMLAAFTCD